jgi:hypothetical protein
LTAGITGSLWDALTFPAQVATGDASADDIDRVMNLAGWVVGGPASEAVFKGAGVRGSVASRAENIYNPPAQMPRSYWEDYPLNVKETPGSPVKFDIDGRPLQPDATVVGRRVVGGIEEGFPPGEFNTLAKKVTGKAPQDVPRSKIEGDSGRLALEFKGKVDDLKARFAGQSTIEIADDLDAASAVKVLAHEIAHGIDIKAVPPKTRGQFRDREWGIRVEDDKVTDQLYRIYRDLNNPPGQPQRIFGPTDISKAYAGKEEAVELWAEAIRAYMADPNYMKTVAPDVAKAIRDNVNAHPELSKIIQFNAGGVPTAAPQERQPTPEEEETFRRLYRQGLAT